MQVIVSLVKIFKLRHLTLIVFSAANILKYIPYAVHSFAHSLLVPHQNFNYFLLNAFMVTTSRLIARYLGDNLAAFHVEKEPV